MMRMMPLVFLLVIGSAFALAPEIAADGPLSGSHSGMINNFAMLLLGLETLFVILISAHLIKFVNITRRNKALIFIYATISLFLFNSVINLLYFISRILDWQIDYMYLYIIERSIMLVAFVIITFGFLKFNKLLRIRV